MRGQFQCAAAPAVAQGIGDELGRDQDHRVRCVRGHGESDRGTRKQILVKALRRQQERQPVVFFTRRSVGRCAPTVAAAQSATSRSARRAARRWVTASAGLSLGALETIHGPLEADWSRADYLIFEHAEIYASRSRHSVAVWLCFLS
ncbi:hypothetical protein GCM10010251_07410 [Streptomyces aurantiogriseus]|uniref:Uncharacterized protein n=1 Tax=Streptomyces aurantiogriseus TaxID=66870 RepID=A0A918BW76_9ACTN|nr:hypothetical protein GCM10010251_07410 [Streptomyces aurantiogriseus]